MLRNRVKGCHNSMCLLTGCSWLVHLYPGSHHGWLFSFEGYRGAHSPPAGRTQLSRVEPDCRGP